MLIRMKQEKQYDYIYFNQEKVKKESISDDKLADKVQKKEVKIFGIQNASQTDFYQYHKYYTTLKLTSFVSDYFILQYISGYYGVIQNDIKKYKREDDKITFEIELSKDISQDERLQKIGEYTQLSQFIFENCQKLESFQLYLRKQYFQFDNPFIFQDYKYIFDNTDIKSQPNDGSFYQTLKERKITTDNNNYGKNTFFTTLCGNNIVFKGLQKYPESYYKTQFLPNANFFMVQFLDQDRQSSFYFYDNKLEIYQKLIIEENKIFNPWQLPLKNIKEHTIQYQVQIRTNNPIKKNLLKVQQVLKSFNLIKTHGFQFSFKGLRYKSQQQPQMKVTFYKNNTLVHLQCETNLKDDALFNFTLFSNALGLDITNQEIYQNTQIYDLQQLDPYQFFDDGDYSYDRLINAIQKRPTLIKTNLKGGSKGTPMYMNVNKDNFVSKHEEEQEKIVKNGILLKNQTFENQNYTFICNKQNQYINYDSNGEHFFVSCVINKLHFDGLIVFDYYNYMKKQGYDDIQLQRYCYSIRSISATNYKKDITPGRCCQLPIQLQKKFGPNLLMLKLFLIDGQLDFLWIQNIVNKRHLNNYILYNNEYEQFYICKPHEDFWGEEKYEFLFVVIFIDNQYFILINNLIIKQDNLYQYAVYQFKDKFDINDMEYSYEWYKKKGYKITGNTLQYPFWKQMIYFINEKNQIFPMKGILFDKVKQEKFDLPTKKQIQQLLKMESFDNLLINGDLQTIGTYQNNLYFLWQKEELLEEEYDIQLQFLVFNKDKETEKNNFNINIQNFIYLKLLYIQNHTDIDIDKITFDEFYDMFEKYIQERNVQLSNDQFSIYNKKQVQKIFKEIKGKLNKNTLQYNIIDGSNEYQFQQNNEKLYYVNTFKNIF